MRIVVKSHFRVVIKAKNRGKFRRYAASKGMSVLEAAKEVMGNPKEHSKTLVKRANFAKNASGWSKHKSVKSKIAK